MKNVFIGLIFTLLDFNFNFNHITIGLIPDFIGYYFISEGLKELSPESENFSKNISLANMMVVFSLILYSFRLFGLHISAGFIMTVFDAVGMGILLYVLYYIIKGVRDIETAKETDFNSSGLEKTWRVFLAVNCAAFVLSFVPVISAVAAVCEIITALVFIFEFGKTKNAYISLLGN